MWLLPCWRGKTTYIQLPLCFIREEHFCCEPGTECAFQQTFHRALDGAFLTPARLLLHHVARPLWYMQGYEKAHKSVDWGAHIHTEGLLEDRTQKQEEPSIREKEWEPEARKQWAWKKMNTEVPLKHLPPNRFKLWRKQHFPLDRKSTKWQVLQIERGLEPGRQCRNKYLVQSEMDNGDG